MKAQRRTKVIILSATALVVLVIVIALQTMAAYPVSGADQPGPLVLTPMETLGLEFYGWVLQVDKTGAEGVDIHMALAGYAGDIVATTDPTGYFYSGFIYIPHEENARVWAEKNGYVFTPAIYQWRFHGPYESRRFNFTIFPPWFTFIPMMMDAGNLP